ncbi:beta-Ig-H3/fasciclin [Verticillium alfalfae VaMs.102]|uniref:Beta-Ig-H3/fasciclin n=1 Tax=Verticillium alfalfae (strain VaMs.102 / ATCC MYA-4576 / FGSC 10136) TaxID=526221 RepID=C9S9K7_VERA1|nr:beta-Ig-H3/fasciclin [Verticillium alfalfae VaMs.102]EEY16070.1 beta-Ig-H3/fasciclin [Verticillium alfalfae VaMs.102]
MYFSGFLTLALAAAAASAQQQLAQLLSQTPELSTLNSLLATVPQVGQMLSTANGITILAPSNQAFDKFMRDHPDQAQMSNNPQAVTALLQYHVVMGTVMSNQLSAQPVFGQTLLNAPFANVTGGQRVELSLVDNRAMILSGYKQMSMVTTADVQFTGGVVHIVDTVLAVPGSPARTAVDMGLTSAAGALGRAQLVDAVNAMRDVTIFAPSNAAFRAIGATADQLQPQQLGAVLQYHVLDRQVLFSSMLAQARAAGGQQGTMLRTLSGAMVSVRMQDGSVFVNSARVIMADVITSNGVVHVLDNVLNPAATQLTPDMSRQTQAPAFDGAQKSNQDPFTQGINPTTTIRPAMQTMRPNAAGHAAAPVAAVMGLFGGAVALANL